MQLLKKVLNISAERQLKTAGDLFVYHSDYHGALQLLEKVLADDPNDTRALVLMGDILFCLNRDKDSLQTLEKAIRLDPTMAEAYISKSGVLEVMGRLRDALQACREALAHAANGKRHYLLAGLFDQEIILLIRMKRFREAQRVLEKALYCLDDEEDVDFLLSSYKGLLDHYCQKRLHTQERARQLSLSIVKNPSPCQAQVS